MKNLIFTVGLVLFSFVSQANVIVVNNNQDEAVDDNLCTLREALVAANYDVAYFGCPAGLGDDLIWLLITTSGDSIQLTSSLPIIDGVDIQGPGVDKLVLFPANGNNGHIFQINTDRDVSFKDFRIGGARSSAIDVVNVDELLIEDMDFISNSAGGSGAYGGAIHADLVSGDTLSINEINISNTKFTNNSAGSGGALAVSGKYPVIISNSEFSQNSSTSLGGAIFKRGSTSPVFSTPLTINNSQFIDNISDIWGSSIYADLVNVNINQSLFHLNQGHSVLYLSRSISYVQNSLFAENSVNIAIVNHSPTDTVTTSELTLNFNTFLGTLYRDVSNTSTNPLLVTTYLKANVFDGNHADHCSGPGIVSLGNNVQRLGANCGLGIDDYPGTDPLLLPLAVYDGDVLIAPPSPISPLVDAGVGCNNFDLSGEGRPRDGNASGGLGQCDIGAVERPNANGLSVSFPGNGSGEVNLAEFLLNCESPDACLWPLPENETFTLTASADTGSTFIQWGGSCSGDTTCEVTMNTFKFVSAEFTSLLAPVTLTVNKNIVNPGIDATVTSSPAGILCGPNCSTDFLENDVVSLIATTGEGTVIDTWMGCDVITNGGAGCKIDMGTTDKTIELFLTQDPDIIFKSGFE